MAATFKISRGYCGSRVRSNFWFRFFRCVLDSAIAFVHRQPTLVDVHSVCRQSRKPEYTLFIVLCKIWCPLLFGRVKMAAGQLTGRLQKAVIEVIFMSIG